MVWGGGGVGENRTSTGALGSRFSKFWVIVGSLKELLFGNQDDAGHSFKCAVKNLVTAELRLCGLYNVGRA